MLIPLTVGGLYLLSKLFDDRAVSAWVAQCLALTDCVSHS